MAPRLVGISGPLSGRVFPITEPGISIGREPSNQVPITDSAVSRRHRVICPEKDRFEIGDLESRNGTFVNGVPVNERTLDHGDEIRIAGSVFLFLEHETDVPVARTTALEVGDEDLSTQDRIELRWDESLYLNPERLLTEYPAAARLVRHFNALVKIVTTLASTRGLEAIEHRLLELIFEVGPASRRA